MTERLYYDDSYATEFTARVVERVEIEGHTALALDRTYFYPTGGGQPHDLGTIQGAPVIDVRLRDGDGAIVHVLGDSPAARRADEEVQCQIDWARRFDHMQHHSGQHILTQSFVERASANTIGFHLSPNSVTIDLDKTVSLEAAYEAEDVANHLVQENRAITARVLDESAARQLGARIRRIPGHLATDGLRVVEVEDFDLTACGGTHVAQTGEIGVIKVMKIEKYKEGSRIEFVCGGRALQDYRAKNEAILRLPADLSVGYWELDQAVARLRDELKDSQSALKRASASLLESEAPALLASATMHDGMRVVVRAFEGRDAVRSAP
jgi:alanyl-tRNA synthetase